MASSPADAQLQINVDAEARSGSAGCHSGLPSLLFQYFLSRRPFPAHQTLYVLVPVAGKRIDRRQHYSKSESPPECD
jgi:hypothetical protein